MKRSAKKFFCWLLFALVFIQTGYADERDDLRVRAQRGDAEAQFQLAEDLTENASDSQDLREAAEWYRKSAAQGHLGALAGLGAVYLDDGTSGAEKENLSRAKNYLSKSAEAGVAKGQYFLASMYADGKGVPQDYAIAYKWWNLAAAQAFPRAAELRNALMEKMSREQITEGQKLSREFMPKFGGNNLWRLVKLHPWLTALGAVALIYAICILVCAARNKFHEGNKLTGVGIFHVLVWTLVPPIWFFIEYYWRDLNGSESNQEAAAKIWAAVLVALLFLVKRS